MTLVPNRLLFTFELSLRLHPKLPALDGRLTGWTDADRLPPLGSIDGRPDFAPIWACWSDSGIAIACCVENKRTPLRCDPINYWKGDNLRVCIDTRPSPDNKRATRYCRQFYFLPTGGQSKSSAVAGFGKFQRAREELPPVNAERLRVAAEVNAKSYRLEAFIPAECMTGFEPREHPRIGLYYMLEDADHGQQYLTVGDDLLWYADPSTWAIAKLEMKPR